VSDGLARDVGHLARASGVRAVIEVASLENETLTATATRLGTPAQELALFGGEDYAVVFSAPQDTQVPGAMRIGWIEAGGERDPVIAQAPDGSRRPLAMRGFDHFAR
jgi:thiamine-monophosphate kinase